MALAFIRVSGAALLLLPWLWLRGEGPLLKRHWRHLSLIGLGNSALPLLCFGYAALHLPTGLAAIFNAATPLSAALIAWAWLGDPLTRWRGLGLALGFAGVAGLAFRLIANIGPMRAASVTFLVPVFATLWGDLVLGESVTPAMALGAAVIVAGTTLVLGLWPRSKATSAA